MSAATQGRSSEYATRDHMIEHGWEFVMRAAASKGAADLLMAHETHGAALVQVGRNSKRLGPADRERLCHASELVGALAILATVLPRQGIAYCSVTRDKPSLWEEWSP